MVLAKFLGFVSCSMSKIWSNLRYFTPQGRHDALITMKFGMERHTTGSLCVPNFTMVVEGGHIPISVKFGVSGPPDMTHCADLGAFSMWKNTP